MAADALIGREQELGLAGSLLASERSLVLGGHAGVGKTKLARALAEAWDGPVEWVSGAAGTSAIPFGAVVRLLTDVGSEPITSAGARELDVIRGALAAARQQPDRLVVVDDCHQLDDLSALLVQQLVLDRTVPVLLTLRTGEPVAATLSSLWTDGHAERVDLLPLSPAETRALSSRLLGGEVEDGTADALFAASQGNPLLLGELVRDATESGRLRRTDADAWRWDGGVGSGRHLRDAIKHRLAMLGDGGRRAVSLLALAEHLGRPLLQRLVPDLDIDDAERRGLLTTTVDGNRVEVRLAHPLLGEVLTADAPDPHAHGGDLADAIAATGARRRGDLLLLARLRLDAGTAADDTELLIDAATRSLLLGAGALARDLAEAALAGDDGPPIAELLLGEALLLERRIDDAEVVLERALQRLETDALRVRAAHALQNLHYQRDSDEPTQRSLTDRALRVVEDPVWRAVLEGNDLQYSMMSGRTRAATERAEALLPLHDDPRVRLRLASAVGSGRALAGRLDAAFEFVAEMLPVALAHQKELPLAPAWVMNAQALALMLAGRLTDASNLITMISSMTVTGATDAGPWIGLFGGRIDLARGLPAQAATQLHDAAAGFGDDDIGGFHRWASSLEAEAVALTGDLERARVVVAEAAASRSRMPIYDGEALRARLWVDALGGELTRAIDGLLELAALQQLEGQHALEIHSLHDAVRLGALGEAGERLLAASAVVEGAWSDAFAGHVHALRTSRGADLFEAGERFASFDARIHAAEAFAEATRAFDAEGLRTRSAAAARRRDEVLAESGPVRTPALQDVAARVELTRREREFVELAVQGATNKEIADRLFVSVRTAEGHLYRAMTKLGVTDRAELARVFA